MVLTYIAQYVFLKISLTFQFLRLLFTTWERSILCAAAVITTTIGTTHFFFYLFLCGAPQHFALTLFTQPQKCHSATTDSIFQYIQVSSSVAFDLIVVGLPLRHVLTSRTMNMRAKATVSFIILLFIGGLAASIVRLALLQNVYDVNIIQKGNVGSIVFYIEGALFIIGGCLGTLRPLVSRPMDKKPSMYTIPEITHESTTIIMDTDLGSNWNKTPALPPVDDRESHHS